MNILKKIIKRMTIVKDYLSFTSIYYEQSHFWKFLCFRYFLNYNKKIYWPVHEHSEVRGRIFVGKGSRVGHRPNCIIQGRQFR